jgi:hypothetical protein
VIKVIGDSWLTPELPDMIIRIQDLLTALNSVIFVLACRQARFMVISRNRKEHRGFTKRLQRQVKKETNVSISLITHLP